MGYCGIAMMESLILIMVTLMAMAMLSLLMRFVVSGVDEAWKCRGYDGDCCLRCWHGNADLTNDRMGCETGCCDDPIT
jgi:hypothetical protein